MKKEVREVEKGAVGREEKEKKRPEKSREKEREVLAKKAPKRTVSIFFFTMTSLAFFVYVIYNK